jgi:hypothetical protein
VIATFRRIDGLAGRLLVPYLGCVACAALLNARIRLLNRKGRRSNIMATVVVPIAVGAVAVVLVLGLINMLRGGDPNRSQKLMRLRVMLQFVAIVIVMLTIWLSGK